MEITIENNFGEKICIELNEPKDYNGNTALVCHGIGAYKEYPLVLAVAQALEKKGYRTISIDFRYGFGKSSRGMEKASLTSYIEDVKTVAAWLESTGQTMPFTIAGHSMGAMAAIWYAENYPYKVNRLIAISPPIKWRQALTLYQPEILENWEKNGKMKRFKLNSSEEYDNLSIQVLTDVEKYDLLANAPKINADVLVIAGENDKTAPVEHVRELYENVSSVKQLAIIAGADHIFSSEKNKEDMESTIMCSISPVKSLDNNMAEQYEYTKGQCQKL